MNEIKKQYENWIYPEPVMDMVEAIKNGYSEHHDLQLYGNMYWHERKSFEKIEILIAGCGTNSAAYNAIRNPMCHITGIDISEYSLNHERYLINKHQIKNLDLINISIDNIANINKKYDFILCSEWGFSIEKSQVDFSFIEKPPVSRN